METVLRPLRAPEIAGDHWFNGDPISLSMLGGYIVLVDFWDYNSHSCLRPLPYIQEWNRRYNDFGLVSIGVHSPEFPFAADPANVSRAIEKLGIRYRVVMDNAFRTWNAYNARLWPTMFLIDKNGFIRFVQQGEGSYQTMEHSIQILIAEAGFRGELPLVMEPLRDEDAPGAVCYRATPEILAGYRRGTIGNTEGYFPESVAEYRDPEMYLEGRVYLHGNWLTKRDFLKLEQSGGEEGHLVVSYQARDVDAVIKPEGESNFQIFVMQDRGYLTGENKGTDVLLDDEGRSYMLISEPRLYNIVKNREFGEHTVKLSSRSNGFAIYSISFASCVIPELVTNN